MSHKAVIAMLLLSIVFLGKFSPGRVRALPTEPEAVAAMMAGQVGSHPTPPEAPPEATSEAAPGVTSGASRALQPPRLWLLESMDLPPLCAGEAAMDEQDEPARLYDAIMTGQWFDTRLIRVIAPRALLEHFQRRSAHRWATPIAPSR